MGPCLSDIGLSLSGFPLVRDRTQRFNSTKLLHIHFESIRLFNFNDVFIENNIFKHIYILIIVSPSPTPPNVSPLPTYLNPHPLSLSSG